MLLQLALAQTNLMRSVIKCLSRKLSVEREQAVALLYELSKSAPLCEAIGDANGAILILVGMTSSDSENAKAAELANKTLNNLEGSDNNVRQMAENGRLQPLLTRLVEGNFKMLGILCTKFQWGYYVYVHKLCTTVLYLVW